MGTRRRGRPKTAYPAFDNYVYEEASCPCRGFECSNRTLMNTCGRPGGGRLYRTDSKIVCIDVAIPAETRDTVKGGGGAKDSTDGSGRGQGLAPPGW